MDGLFAFAASVFALLSVPGPTNTLLATSGAARGVRGSLLLLPAELAGHSIAIGLWLVVVDPLAQRFEVIPTIAKLIAAAYLLWAAWRLWSSPPEGGGSQPVGPRRLFVATLLNPKAMILAFVIFPHGAVDTLGPYALVFVVLEVTIGAGWIWLGHGMARMAGGMATTARILRIGAVALVLFATFIAASAVD